VDASRPGACRTLLSDERLRPKLLLGAGLEQAWSRLDCGTKRARMLELP
jgi:hypothetical protein